jgi:hypothetical protein
MKTPVTVFLYEIKERERERERKRDIKYKIKYTYIRYECIFYTFVGMIGL